jgi:monovalent cation:H+ antiporter, CPA1 family
MTGFQIIAVLISLAALFGYLNFRFFHLPMTIGVMAISLVVSLSLIAVGHFHPEIEGAVQGWLRKVEFDDVLMQGMLSFLLFAGALQINLNELADQKAVIAVLAVGGVVLSTVLFGTAVYFSFAWVGVKLPYAWCLLFGALISPTDPIAVLGILKTARVPKSLEVQIAGESLFNDGIGVVAFLVCSEVAVQGEKISTGHIALLFLREAVGGGVFGLLAGYVTYRLLKSVDHYQVEVLLTLALVMGGYALASALGLSGPIAIVVAGLLIGNHGRRLAMSQTTREHLDSFWELLDEILNAILFVLIGLELIALTFSRNVFVAGLMAIPALLLARWASVALPVTLMSPWCRFSRGTIKLMTWGGLRGGISVALALSLPAVPERQTILVITYMLVVFSILAQGLTMGALVRRTGRGKEGAAL